MPGGASVAVLLLRRTAVTRFCAVQGGRTAIFKAARGGFAKVVELLISKKANVNLSEEVRVRIDRERERAGE